MSFAPIHLRRPAVLNMVEGTFVPEAAHRNGQRIALSQREILKEVDRRWAALRAKNPNYFDGRLLHVLGVHRNGHGGATLHVIECAYRFHAVQTEDFDLGVRALGVKGVTTHLPSPVASHNEARGFVGGGEGTAFPSPFVLKGRGGGGEGFSNANSQEPTAKSSSPFLLGRRSHSVAAYQGLWEFAPAGSVEPGESPEQLVQRELGEETGLIAVGEPIPRAVLYDPVLRCWELVFDLMVGGGLPSPHTAEYSELAWRTLDDLPSPLSPVARQIADILARRDVGSSPTQPR